MKNIDLPSETKVRGILLASVLAATLGVVVVGMYMLGIPGMAGALALLFLLILIIGHRNALPILTAVGILLALLPLPKGLPVSLPVGGGTLLLADLVMVAVIGLFTRRIKCLPSAVRWCLIIVVAVIVYGAGYGIAQGAAVTEVLGDVRGLLYTIIVGVGVGVSLLDTHLAAKRILLHTATFTVIYSAIAVLVEAFLQLNFFAIRAGSAVLYTAGGMATPEAAVRLVPTSGLTCVIITGALLGLWFSKKVTSREYPAMWPVIICGLYIGFQGFSRNNLIALVVVVFGCLAINIGLTTIIRAICGVAVFSLLTVIGWRILSELSPTFRAVSRQSIDGFQTRVLGGLNPDTVAGDYSSQWRVTESAAGLQSIQQRPMGTGLGVPYRGWLPGEPFTSDYGYTYLHNSYLWFPVKTGLLSSLVVLTLVVSLGFILFKARNRINNKLFSLIVSATAGLAIVMIVSPLPFSRGDGVLCGAVLGLCFWSLGQADKASDISSKAVQRSEPICSPVAIRS